MPKTSLKLICALSVIALACDDADISLEIDQSDNESVESEHRDDDILPEEQSFADDEFINEEHERAGSCATLFEHIHYNGERREVNRGDNVRWIGGPWNDHVSSIKVRPGCVLNAYEHKDYGGKHKTFIGNVPRVGDWWNDRISAYTCSC